MKIKFFDFSKFFMRASYYKKGDYMAMKKIMKKGKENGYLE